MKCRRCRHPDSKVLESRETKEGLTIRRRRECQNCGHRFTTFERQEEQPLMVVKRDGTKELFEREKVLRSLMIACRKRDVSLKELEMVVDWITKSLSENEVHVIEASNIGELILEALRHIDPVAYVRFASVYRAFSNVEDFVNELRTLEEKVVSSSPDKLLSKFSKK